MTLSPVNTNQDTYNVKTFTFARALTLATLATLFILTEMLPTNTVREISLPDLKTVYIASTTALETTWQKSPSMIIEP